MNQKRKQRLILIGLVMVGLGTGIGLVLAALNENINLFYTPTQIARGEAPTDHYIRIGGLVSAGSIEKADGELTVRFKLNDTVEEVSLEYAGILPDLFREGQGIVAQGKLSKDGMFVADQVLAKHDENYMPSEVAAALEKNGMHVKKGTYE